MNKFGGRNGPRVARGGGGGGGRGGGPAAKRFRNGDSQEMSDEEDLCDTPDFDMEDDEEAMMAMMADDAEATEMMAADDGGAGGSMEAKWARPEREKPLDPREEDLVFQQIEIDHYIGGGNRSLDR